MVECRLLPWLLIDWGITFGPASEGLDNVLFAPRPQMASFKTRL